jgi:hypothetical protein
MIGFVVAQVGLFAVAVVAMTAAGLADWLKKS